MKLTEVAKLLRHARVSDGKPAEAAFYVRSVSGGWALYDAEGEYLGTGAKEGRDLRSAKARVRAAIRLDAYRRGIIR